MSFSDDIVIRERTVIPVETVETYLAQYNLGRYVSRVFNEVLTDSERKSILSIPIRYNRSVRLGGYWKPQERIIYINRVLNGADSDKTFLHELAHAIADTHWGMGIQAHGREWQLVMYAMEQEPERCHNYNYLRVLTRERL
jgi:predicted SprT family Zn-dependent metalloprotease